MAKQHARHQLTFSIMYLGPSQSVGPPRRLGPKSFLSKTIDKEIYLQALPSTSAKDKTPSSLQIKGPKQADALKKVELAVLRSQINAFPDELNEETRKDFALAENDKRKSLQDLQCKVLIKMEVLLKQHMVSRGEKILEYKIGGYDQGAYERFFRVEPANHMSKSQFITAMRVTFGQELCEFESVLSRLFESFDGDNSASMDWRSFLYVLSVLMMPALGGSELLRLGYALYCSVGSLDLDCAGPL
ncbi:hypothetical protein EON65_43795, partial [archaeon]